MKFTNQPKNTKHGLHNLLQPKQTIHILPSFLPLEACVQKKAAAQSSQTAQTKNLSQSK
ncbi:hypothetical protein Hanom_Chr12g01149761 [Helianthus anomalus]